MWRCVKRYVLSIHFAINLPEEEKQKHKERASKLFKLSRKEDVNFLGS
jgi:hypothetical protein